VDASANIFGAGRNIPPAPGGGGGGSLPPQISFPAYSYRSIEFTDIHGTTSKMRKAGTCVIEDPDGTTECGGGTNISSFGGISGIRHDSKAMFLVGVFLGELEPGAPAPQPLDVTNANDIERIEPELHQLFFIGDGKTESGIRQSFRIPAGATRLFLGFADAPTYEPATPTLPGSYDDNSGTLHVTNLHFVYLPFILRQD